MRSGLGHRAVWYMFMDVLEEQFGSILKDHQKMEAVCTEWPRYRTIRLHGSI